MEDSNARVSFGRACRKVIEKIRSFALLTAPLKAQKPSTQARSITASLGSETPTTSQSTTLEPSLTETSRETIREECRSDRTGTLWANIKYRPSRIVDKNFLLIEQQRFRERHVAVTNIMKPEDQWKSSKICHMYRSWGKMVMAEIWDETLVKVEEDSLSKTSVAPPPELFSEVEYFDENISEISSLNLEVQT